MNDLIKLIEESSGILPFCLTEAQKSLLYEYALLLQTSPRKSFASWDSDASGFELHFKDSFHTFPEVNLKGSFIDVGAGAGVPGIIYSILTPQVTAVLLDSQTLRCEFMKSALLKLELQDRVRVVCGRAEKVSRDKEFKEKFSLVTARALAPFPAFFDFVSGFTGRGGAIHAIRGEKDSDFFNYPEKFRQFGFSLKSFKSYRLKPESGLRFSAILVKL